MWHIAISKPADKTLQKLERQTREAILLYLHERVAPADNPKLYGNALIGKFKGLWRYRVGDYRIICQIRAEIITVLVLDIGHRKDIYR